MIIVPVKEGENIEKALKKFKRKFEKTGVIKELRARQQFAKPSMYRSCALTKSKKVRENLVVSKNFRKFVAEIKMQRI